LILGAWSAVPSAPQAGAAVALVLDRDFSRALTRQVGLPVAILGRDDALQDVPQGSLRTRVLDAEEPLVERLDEVGLYLSVQPLRAPGGGTAGLVETSLPTAGVLPSQRRFLRSLFL